MAILFGFIFGVICGCGIGGGSILVPLLVLFMGVEQAVAQGVCLIAFLPSAICALGVHIKNKNVDFECVKGYAPSGIVFALIGSFVTGLIDTALLRKGFGVFLVVFGVYQAISIGREIKSKDKVDIEKSGK